ncbi:hypothetical protein FNV43_RR00009 [Rhamnella rubrinervis]|uniref:Uncharacterized protein n=1 Tax=Rhamnella rubrinervis TaxID=2594499 RepID=A0A8K0HM15_9ROSA|nr:hypothetical protein FNV43_RR00009 [Rhamnella rubrinervis]
MPIGRFQQMQEDHYHDMYMWYLDQFDEDPTEQRAMRGHVQARGFGGPPVAAAVLAKDSEEDSLGTDEYVPRGYTPNPVDPEDFDPWDEPTRDATSRLVEAIERLVAQNVQQQQPRQQQQFVGINAVVKQFRDLHPPEFDGSMNPLVAENWIRKLEIFLLTDVSET